MLKQRARRHHYRWVRSLTKASLAVTRNRQQPELFEYMRRLANASLGLPRGWLIGLVPANLGVGAEWCLRQLLWFQARQPLGARADLVRFINGDPGPFFAPLPSAWRNELRSFGMKLDFARSSWSFLRFQISGYASGIRRIMHYVRNFRRFGRPDGRYAVLYHARSLNVPPRNCPPPHWDWATWTWESGLVEPGLRLWAVSLAGEDVARENIETVPNPLPILRSRGAALKFAALTMQIMVVTTLRWLSGAWWAPIMLREFVDLAYVRCVASSDLAVSYFFPPQFSSLRPLWTWAVEKQDSKAIKVSYSHNFQTTFLRGKPDLPMSDPTYSLMCWSDAVYLTEQCGPFMESLGAPRHRHIVGGPVAFVDEGGLPPKTNRPAIAVFDTDPWPRVDRAIVGMPQYWHSVDIVRTFLDEVSAAIRDAGAVPVWKLKGTIFDEEARHAGALRYDHVAHRSIARKHDVVICEDTVPVHRLAGSVDAAIVLPFTTPATIFRQFGLPAAYYDPTGELGGNIVMARGAQILTDRRALRVWLQEVLERVGKQQISA
jgi:hypothetical protein